MIIGRYPELSRGQEEAVLELVHASFGIRRLPRVDVHFCGWDNAVLVAYCALQKRIIRMGSRQIPAAILGMVTVRPPDRNRGLGGQLLASVREYSRRAEDASMEGIVLNCGESRARFYEMNGFLRISGSAIYRRGETDITDADPVYWHSRSPVFPDGNAGEPVFLGEDF